MLCQFCGAVNHHDRERCQRCGCKLMVVSGVAENEREPAEELFIQAQEDLEEHILERISALEDGVRRLSQAVAGTAEHLGQLEHNLTVAHAGIQSLGGLLETQGIVTRAEVVDRWERAADQELLSRELSRRYKNFAGRILSQAEHFGQASDDFRRTLRALELALVSSENDVIHELLTELLVEHRALPSVSQLQRRQYMQLSCLWDIRVNRVVVRPGQG